MKRQGGGGTGKAATAKSEHGGWMANGGMVPVAASGMPRPCQAKAAAG